MDLKTFLNSKQVKQLGALSMVVQAGLALREGKVKLALLYVLGAGVSYKNSTVGFVAQIALRAYRKFGSTSAT